MAARTQARMLAELWGSAVDVAFGSAATPSVPDVVTAPLCAAPQVVEQIRTRFNGVG